MAKPQGHFLIRVSESRPGYTLSYRYVTGERCSFHAVPSHKAPLLPLSLSGRQSWGPLQTFHDRFDGGRPLRHSGGEEAPPVSAGPGGLSPAHSHRPVQWSADRRLWKGATSRKLTSATATIHLFFFLSHFKRMTRSNIQNFGFCKEIWGTTHVCSPTALCFPVGVVRSPLTKSHLPSRIDPTLTCRSQPARTYMPLACIQTL